MLSLVGLLLGGKGGSDGGVDALAVLEDGARGRGTVLARVDGAGLVGTDTDNWWG
jgi:hypothetical protein